MTIATVAAPTGVLSPGHFREVPNASQVLETVDLSQTLRLGKNGEKPGDLLILAVAHRTALKVDDALQFICTEELVDSTGIHQSLSMYYLQLGANDVGRAFKFTQPLPLRLSVMCSVQRPVNTLAPLTVQAFSQSRHLNAPAPWSVSPVTPTKVGQLVVVTQARVSADTEDVVVAPFLARNLSPAHSRVSMFALDVQRPRQVEGYFEMPKGSNPSTSVLSVSVVFNLEVPKIKQEVFMRSAGAEATLPSSDITEGGRLWTVRSTAEPTYWHKAASTTFRHRAGLKYFEVEIVDGPAIGAGRVMGIGVTTTGTTTASGAGPGQNMATERAWFNDGSVYDRAAGVILPGVTPPWGKGDKLGISVDLTNNDTFGAAGKMYGYLNGKPLGAILPSLYQAFDNTSIYVGGLGRAVSLRFPSTLDYMPHGNTAW